MLRRPAIKSSSREHSNFQSRTAEDVAGELNRRSSNLAELDQAAGPADSRPDSDGNPYDPATNASTPPPREHSLTKRLFNWVPHVGDTADGAQDARRESSSVRRRSHNGSTDPDSTIIQLHNQAENKKANGDSSAPRPGLGPRPVGGSDKLGMFSGVYVPTCLNVLSILMFLRFGFLLGLFFQFRYAPKGQAWTSSPRCLFSLCLLIPRDYLFTHFIYGFGRNELIYQAITICRNGS